MSGGNRFESDEAFLRALLDDPSGGLWPVFLTRYTRSLMKVISGLARPEDDPWDTYGFVIEKLAENDLARIRRYMGEPPPRRARFTTWLSVVVRRLCIDKYRADHGRRTMPTAVARMDDFHQRAFRLYFWAERSYAEIVELLRETGFKNTTVRDVSEAIASICAALPTTSRWALIVETDAVSLDGSPDSEGGFLPPILPAPGENPAEAYERRQSEAELARIMADFSAEERLLLSLRYLDCLNARQIAKLMGLESERLVFQRLRALIGRFRRELGVAPGGSPRRSGTGPR